MDCHGTKWPARKAYRELALLHHPDKGGSDGDFKLLRRAYEDGLIAVKRKEEAAYKPKPGPAVRGELTSCLNRDMDRACPSLEKHSVGIPSYPFFLDPTTCFQDLFGHNKVQ
jgi:hypothetical protein